MFIPEPKGGDFAPVPAGTHAARCYRFLDLGSHLESYKGVPKPDLTHKVLLGWELVDELMPPNAKGEKLPFIINKKYTWSMSDRARLRADLESWRGKRFEQADFGPGGFDVKNLINQPAILGVVQEEKDGKVYSNITSIQKPMKGQTVGPLVNPTQYLELTKDGFDRNLFNGLSDKLKQLIADSPEYMRLFEAGAKSNGGNYAEQSGREGRRVPPPLLEELDDQIPFAPEFR